MAIDIAIIGLGKIARDQHIPAIAANPAFNLVAGVSPRGGPEPGLRTFTGHPEMIAAMPDLKAVAICTPPGVRYAIARDCILAGLDVLLEKPPATTLGEIAELERLAAEHGTTLFATWHAQHNPAVSAAAEMLAGQRIATIEIAWHEDVRKWHPGQEWIWAPGGFGVFDPGINALSIASRIVPGALIVDEATLRYPSNKQTPIAAELTLSSPACDGPITASFDWDHRGAEAWTIEIETKDGARLLLSEGGARLAVDGVPQPAKSAGEYPSIYRRFAELVAGRRSEVDSSPLRLVADALLKGRRVESEPFET